MDVRAAVAEVLGRTVTDVDPLGGGCVSQVFALELDGGGRVVAKFDPTGHAHLPVEAAMLAFLARETTLPVPHVLSANDHLLLLEYVDGQSQFSPAAETHAAELLAALHEHTAPRFGFKEPTLIGGLTQPNPWDESWLRFFAEQRLVGMARQALEVGRLSPRFMERVERLAADVGRWLSEPDRPSLIHGDVWTTNVLARDDRVVAFLDPAIYFADREIELAFTTLFGTFGRPFYERYEQLRPIRAGFFEERRHLYNLYPLLVHVRLFGGSYLSAVGQTLDRFGY